MIRSVHTMFYSSETEELRAFLRDKFSFTETDKGRHTADETHPAGEAAGSHHISSDCDDLDTTVRELREKHVEFIDEPKDQGYGTAIHFKTPGGLVLELYRPHYTKGS